MTFEYLIDPAHGPRWQGLLPGTPDAFFLSRGEGEHAKLFGDLFTVLLSGDETGGQFGIITSQSPAGDIIPTHAHAAQIAASTADAGLSSHCPLMVRHPAMWS